MMYDKAQCKILFQIIRVSLFDSDEFEINAEADWKLIYRISREHKIHTILCRGLEKISSKDKIPEKMIGKLEELWQIERAKDAVQKYSIDEILDAFEKDKIDCMPLKGIYMKEFYPDSSLRTMSDLDIFYRQGDEEKIEKVLVLCEKEFPKIDGEDLVWFYFPVTIFITGSGTEEQYARVVKLHEYIYEHTEHRPLQIGLGNMLNARNQKQN